MGAPLQVTSLRAQMEFQTAELRQTAEQVALMKQEFERRERSLQQMLDQARLGQEEEQRTSEMQLALKLKRQEDQAEAQEAKIRALEESGKRQQELYERHVGQLTEQMRNSQDNFRKQLEAVQAENDESLQAAKGKFAEVERSLKSERERVVAEVQQEREEHASKLAQAEELSSRVGGMQKETEELRKQLLEAVRVLNLWHLWAFAGPEPTFDEPLAQAHQMDVVRSTALAGTRVPTVFGGYSVVDSLLAAPT
ncbi:unnamed protein product [Effrenium voratum]|uniref:Uncharacterized protein n=1 Tax=Effrenium voratum TaxID=2562239 RepID=A0AA36IWM3_9DINO|nr:unnamed protein product [Effrenium voratum]